MATKARSITAEFSPEVRFEVRPNAARAGRLAEVAKLEQLKIKLVADWMRQVRNPEKYSVIRWAASEAVSLAWLSGMPLLTLPVLLEEKVKEALHRLARQKQILAKSEQLLRAA